MIMESYTWGSPEGVQAVIAALPARYPMELVPSDMEALITALVWAHETWGCDDDDDSHRANGGDCPDTCLHWRIGTLAGDIATTVGVEWI